MNRREKKPLPTTPPKSQETELLKNGKIKREEISDFWGSPAAMTKAVNSAKSAKEQLEEAKHNIKLMEAIALRNGLYLGSCI